MKVIFRWEVEWARRERKVFSAKGHPQWRRKVITRSFPLASGMGSSGVEGALSPVEGGDAVEMEGGDSHDLSSCWYDIPRVQAEDSSSAYDT